MFREFAKALDFTMAPDETVDGYDCWVLLAKPKPGYKPASFRTSFLTQMEGKVWISKKFSRMVKLDAVTIGPVSFGGFLAKLEPGSRVEVEQITAPGRFLASAPLQTNLQRPALVQGIQGRDGAVIHKLQARQSSHLTETGGLWPQAIDSVIPLVIVAQALSVAVRRAPSLVCADAIRQFFRS